MYIAMWEYQVKKEHEPEFAQAYGPEGAWAVLFRQGKGCLSTELFKDLKQDRRYVTLDRWESEAAWEAFRHEHSKDYSTFNDRCEAWTEHEQRLGTFELTQLP